MKMKGAIFDLDGTLLDSMGMWYTIGEEYLTQKGITPPANLWGKLKTLSMVQSAVFFKETYGLPESVEEIISQVNALIEHKYFTQIQLKPGVLPLVRELHRRGVKMCVATASDRHLAEGALKRLGVMEYLCGIFTCTEVGCGKDQPLIYEKAMERMHTSKSDTVVFEDALHAVETAKGAGFLVMGVHDASADEDWEQIKKSADWYIHSFREVELSNL